MVSAFVGSGIARDYENLETSWVPLPVRMHDQTDTIIQLIPVHLMQKSVH